MRVLRIAAALGAAVVLLAACTEEPRDPATVPPTVCATDEPCGVGSVTPATIEWREINAIPEPAREESAAAVVGGKIFLIGGLVANGDATDLVDSFDPVDGTWTREPPLPIAIHHAMAAEQGGRLFVIGGFSGDLGGDAVDRVFILENGNWSEGPRLRRPRAAGGAVNVGGLIVVVGGISGGVHVAPVEILSHDGWNDGAPTPLPRDHVGVATDGRLVYAGGGRAGGGHFPTFDVYDPAADRWSDLPEMPTPRSGNGAAFVAGKVINVGGEGPRIFPEVEAYDVASKIWSRLPDLKIPVHGVGVVAIGSNLYAFAGGFKVGLAPSRAAQVLAVG